ncbi:hypothetical protein AB0M91_19770 [Micromonospora rifamycinica]|uniref:hypothetical protein n=1 Tax=Micromonospora rifamycinica TaxID=291594 RepID=UPI0033F4BCCF
MRTPSRVATALVLACAVAVANSSVAAAQPPASEVGSAGTAQTVGAAGSDQCSVDVKARKGAWVCPDATSSGRPKNWTDKRANQAALLSGVCSALGCYYYSDSTMAYFDGAGQYGYGGTKLGDVYLYVEDYFSGGSSTSKRFQFESTRGIRTINASGERLYFSSTHPEGYPVSGGGTFKTWGAHGPYAAGTLVTAFGSTGYTAYEGSVAWAGIAHQFQWTDPSSAYPGTWYMWWKSPKFQRQSSGQYTVSNPPAMGSSWYGSGWNQ